MSALALTYGEDTALPVFGHGKGLILHAVITPTEVPRLGEEAIDRSHRHIHRLQVILGIRAV